MATGINQEKGMPGIVILGRIEEFSLTIIFFSWVDGGFKSVDS